MSIQWDSDVQVEPFWLQEAMACMNYVDALDSEDWLNKSSSWNRRQKEEFLAPYRSYRGAMRTRLQPILEQYPMVMGYVDTTPRKEESLGGYDPPIMSFLMHMQYVLESPEHPSEEKLEEMLSSAFQRMLGTDMQESPEAEGPVIHSMPDVLAALEHWGGEDADKFKLLRLYSERREIMEQLWSLQGPCTEIGRSCLELVRERYDACIERMQKPGEVRALLEALGLQYGESHIQRITPTIMQYGRVMLQMTEEEETDIKLHFGIEIFYLHDTRQEDLYKDDWLLSRLKALGDPTRLKILHQLIERPCYLQEMARALELTPATVLHHLGVLMMEELIEIKVTQEKKKVYYQVKRQGVQDVGAGILQLTMTRQEREEQQKQRQIKEGQQIQGGWQWDIQK